MAAYAGTGEYGRVWIAARARGRDRRPRPPRALVVGGARRPAHAGRELLRQAGGAPGAPATGGHRAGREACPTTLSFPSAHAATSFAAATLIGALAPPLRPALYGAAALMAFTRPYLGVHYPSDVLAGAARRHRARPRAGDDADEGRHRRPAERRQVDALQRAHPRRGGGGRVPVHDRRSERRGRAGAGRAPRADRRHARDRAAGPRADRVRRRRRARARRPQGRGPRQPLPRPRPRRRRDPARRARVRAPAGRASAR